MKWLPPAREALTWFEALVIYLRWNRSSSPRRPSSGPRSCSRSCSIRTPRPSAGSASSPLPPELPKSTASRLLATLEQHGLVEQEGERGGFRPGPVIQRHAGRARGAAPARGRRGADGRARRAHGGDDQPRGGRRRRRAPRRPDRRPPLPRHHASGSAAACPTTAPPTARCCSPTARPSRPPGRSRRSPRARSSTAGCSTCSSPRVRDDGFAVAAEELELGLSAVAAPVFDSGGGVVAALSVSGPTLRLSPRRVAELRPIVIKQARALSEALGHRPEGVHAA